MNYYLKVVILVAVAALIIYLVPRTAQSPDDNNNNGNNGNNATTVTDFESCAAAGFPIMESYPEQCRTSDGRTFTREVPNNAEVVVDTPTQGQLVTSPLTVKGKAKGTWFFEDNFPVTLKDQNGKVLAQTGFKSKDGNWMTTDFVDFEGTLTFAKPTTEFGTLVIQNDNPSGLEQFDKEFVVTVRFR